MVQFCLIGILVDLLQNPKCTARELSEKYEVSTRSIYRYIDLLACNGIPVITTKGAKGGIKIEKNFCLSSNLLSEDEKCYLFSLLQNKSDNTSTAIVSKLNLNKRN